MVSMFELIELSDKEIEVLYRWKTEEKQHELYSCRPVNSVGTYEEFYNRTVKGLEDKTRKHLVLRNGENNDILGELNGFDYNPRNHSMEFGYYVPAVNRHKGYGGIMIRLFIDEAFQDTKYELNKVYATTAGNNQASKGVLEKTGFKLDGRNREHYWIDGERYDQYVYSLLRREWEEVRLINT
jgi:[ribosomal protein S5]-alanine N-acetyltransferase